MDERGVNVNEETPAKVRKSTEAKTKVSFLPCMKQKQIKNPS